MTWNIPTTPLAGAKLTLALWWAQVRDNFKAIGDPWTTFACTWQATGTAPVVGNGTLVCKYMLAGGFVRGRIMLTVGSTTTFGTGFYNFTLPITLASGLFWESLGSCSVRDVSASASYGLGAMSASASTVSAASSAGARLAAGAPIALATGDTISFEFAGEAA